MTMRDQVTEDDRWALWRYFPTEIVHVYHSARYDGKWSLCGIPLEALGQPRWKVRKEWLRNAGWRLCLGCKAEWIKLFGDPNAPKVWEVRSQVFRVEDSKTPGRLGRGPYTVTLFGSGLADCTCTTYFFRKAKRRQEVGAARLMGQVPCEHIEAALKS